MSDNITHITVVGGGTAGWLTAAVIAAEHRVTTGGKGDEHGFKLTLVESPDIPTIGVGEGTWPSMRATLKKIGISEADFLRECNASFKQGTLFHNWLAENNQSYAHPFTLPQGYAEMNLAPYWRAKYGDHEFADMVCPQTALFSDYLAPKQISTPEYGALVNYGYHLDAAKFADLLQRHCVENLGVTHVKANVTGIDPAENGDIAAINTDSAGRITSDLFIDCSGSRGLLLSEHYKIPLVPMDNVLFNDTALAVQVPYNEEDAPIESCTLSTARSAGWIWDIGLPTRRGIGYVYSQAHETEDQAAASLVGYVNDILGAAAAEQVSYRKLSFRPGYREKFWHHNCVAVGMASGFIEPLEASALVMVELGAAMIAEQLPATRSLMDQAARRYNEKCRGRWQSIIEFLKLHYVLSDKQEPYWRDHRAAASIPSALQDAIDWWRYQDPWHHSGAHLDDLFPTASYQYILCGMRFQTEPRPTSRYNEEQKSVAAEKLIQENARRISVLKTALPTNRELLKKVSAYGFQSR